MAPIAVERCIAGRELGEPRLAPHGGYVVHSVSSSGVAALVGRDLGGGGERQLTAHPPPRPGRGLGGGCWCFVAGGQALVYAGDDGNLWLQPLPGGGVRRLTDHGPERVVSSPHAALDHPHVAYVVDQCEVWTVSLDTGEAVRIDDGSADFCLDPFVTPDGADVLWQAWDVPDMPWDASRIERAAVRGGSRATVRGAGAIQQPRVMPGGRVVTVRDDGGWLNVWVDDAPLTVEPFEHAGPTWGPGQRSFAWSPDGSEIAFTRNERGFGRLCVADVATGTARQVAKGVHGQLSWAGDRLLALRTGARTPTQLVAYDTTRWSRTVLAVGPVSGWEDESLAEPETVEVDVDGATVFARVYLADEPAGRVLCWLHGGPTDQWQVTFMPRVAYWRSRGYSVVVPDHRGSTGHGRDYQQALRGRWGELDVADTVAILEAIQRAGWSRPAGTALAGSSAGGFTALGVAAHRPDLVSAVVVAYPVTDLVDLAERSHRFERHYTDSLVGPPGDPELVRRSPSTFPDRLLATPVLLFHGDADPVVPVQHSEVFAQRLRAAGGDVDLVVYPGEGHGFRRPEHQLDEYARTEAFLARTLSG